MLINEFIQDFSNTIENRYTATMGQIMALPDFVNVNFVNFAPATNNTYTFNTQELDGNNDLNAEVVGINTTELKTLIMSTKGVNYKGFTMANKLIVANDMINNDNTRTALEDIRIQLLKQWDLQAYNGIEGVNEGLLTNVTPVSIGGIVDASDFSSKLVAKAVQTNKLAGLQANSPIAVVISGEEWQKYYMTGVVSQGLSVRSQIAEQEFINVIFGDDAITGSTNRLDFVIRGGLNVWHGFTPKIINQKSSGEFDTFTAFNLGVQSIAVNKKKPQSVASFIV